MIELTDGVAFRIASSVDIHEYEANPEIISDFVILGVAAVEPSKAA